MKYRLAFAAPLLLAAEVIAAAPGEGAPRLTESPLSAGNLIETALGLVLVLGVMLGLAWMVKRYVQVPGIGKGQVQILGGTSLGARERVVLLSVEGRRLLVGVAPGRVQTLLVLNEADAPPRQAFAEQLAAARADEPIAAGEQA